MATRKKKKNIGSFGHPIYGKGFAKYGEMRTNGSSEIPNDLEEAAEEHSFTHHETNESLEEAVTHQMEDDGDVDDFIRKGLDETVLKYAQIGAKWQADQFEKNRLAHCDGLTKEEYDRETDFALEIINKEHRQPTFTDAINYGMRLQAEKDKETIELAEEHAYFAGAVNEREQMMKEAVEGKVFMSFAPGHNQMVMADVDLPTNTKVKVIIVKED